MYKHSTLPLIVLDNLFGVKCLKRRILVKIGFIRVIKPIFTESDSNKHKIRSNNIWFCMNWSLLKIST